MKNVMQDDRDERTPTTCRRAQGTTAPEWLPIGHAAGGELNYGLVTATQWIQNTTSDIAPSQLPTEAVALEFVCGDSRSQGDHFYLFTLALPPRAARALAAALVREADVAEAAGAIEWAVAEFEPHKYNLRFVGNAAGARDATGAEGGVRP